MLMLHFEPCACAKASCVEQLLGLRPVCLQDVCLRSRQHVEFLSRSRPSLIAPQLAALDKMDCRYVVVRRCFAVFRPCVYVLSFGLLCSLTASTSKRGQLTVLAGRNRWSDGLSPAPDETSMKAAISVSGNTPSNKATNLLVRIFVWDMANTAPQTLLRCTNVCLMKLHRSFLATSRRGMH